MVGGPGCSQERPAEIDDEVGRYVKALGQCKLSVQRLEKEIDERERDKRGLEAELAVVQRRRGSRVRTWLGCVSLSIGAVPDPGTQRTNHASSRTHG